MRNCRDLGYPGLRDFKLALAQELAVGGSPLNRRVRIDDDTRQVIAKLTRGAVTVINSVQAQLDPAAVEHAADAIAKATRVDCYGVGVTSNFMHRTCRRGSIGSASRRTPTSTLTCN
jgi:DNA-binding MurR/RpiR family transcriptional regulator